MFVVIFTLLSAISACNVYGSNELFDTKAIHYTTFTFYMERSKKSAYMFSGYIFVHYLGITPHSIKYC